MSDRRPGLGFSRRLVGHRLLAGQETSAVRIYLDLPQPPFIILGQPQLRIKLIAYSGAEFGFFLRRQTVDRWN